MQEIPIDRLGGQRIGTYHLIRLLEHGRVHALYLAHHPAHRQPVSLTIFDPPSQSSQEASQLFLARFRAKAAALLTLHHPHIFPVFDSGEYAGYPYLVAPSLETISLTELLKQQERLSCDQAQMLLEHVAAGLDYAQSKGMIHGSLTPAHLLLKDDQTFLITGFAWSDLLSSHGIQERAGAYLNAGHIPLFPREYTAPELLAGQPPDARSDVYALGVILFETLSGTSPLMNGERRNPSRAYPLPSLHRLYPSLPLALDQIVQRALDPQPVQRFSSAGELATAFAQVIQARKLSQWETANLAPTRVQERSTGTWQIVPPIITGKISAVAPASPATLFASSLTEQPARAVSLPPDLSEQIVPPGIPEISKTSSPPAEKDRDARTGGKRAGQGILLKLGVGSVAALCGFLAVQGIAALVHLPHLFGTLFP